MDALWLNDWRKHGGEWCRFVPQITQVAWEFLFKKRRRISRQHQIIAPSYPETTPSFNFRIKIKKVLPHTHIINFTQIHIHTTHSQHKLQQPSQRHSKEESRGVQKSLNATSINQQQQINLPAAAAVTSKICKLNYICWCHWRNSNFLKKIKSSVIIQFFSWSILVKILERERISKWRMVDIPLERKHFINRHTAIIARIFYGA